MAGNIYNLYVMMVSILFMNSCKKIILMELCYKVTSPSTKKKKGKTPEIYQAFTIISFTFYLNLFFRTSNY